MTRTAGQLISIDGVPNLRDIGGWPTGGGGRVRYGLLYRSVELNHLDDAGVAAFAALGVRTVFDLRTAVERDAKPDRVPAGTADVALDVLADAPADGFGAHALQSLATDPSALAPLFAGGRAERALADSYRDIVGSRSALAAYRRLYTDLADPGIRPALIHCTTGKDRTGWGAAALLLFLGVSLDDVMQDYLFTNDELLPALTPLLDKFAADGGDPDQLRQVLGVKREYLETGLSEMSARYGDIDGYFRDGLRLEESTISALRAAFVEPGTPGGAPRQRA
jgi:protein-tyrosine phosphatase